MKLNTFLVAVIVLSESAVALAQNSEVEKYVNSVRSVEQVKEASRGHLIAECATGSCVNNTTTEICTLVGALDVRVGNAISSSDSKYISRPDLSIAPRDLRTFKQIWGQCKPTTYQYWNFGQVVHVAYDPDPRTDSEVRRSLGINVPSQPPAEVKSAPSTTTDPDKKLTSCLMPKAQYGQYSSYDGGKSAASLLQESCPTQYLEWVESCIANGESKTNCVTKAAIIAQTAIKLFNK